MKAKQFGDTWIVRIDRGEEIVEMITNVCTENQIYLGQISAIGAVDEATIGLYDVKNQIYHSEKFTGDMEIANLSGNISTMNDDIYLHLHISLSDSSHKLFGGHLNAGIVSATCEVFIQTVNGRLDRYKDSEVGLNLLKLQA